MKKGSIKNKKFLRCLNYIKKHKTTDFGILVNELRIKRGLTQQELASGVKVGQSFISQIEKDYMDRTYVSKIEKHSKIPTPGIAIKMSKILASDDLMVSYFHQKIKSALV